MWLTVRAERGHERLTKIKLFVAKKEKDWQRSKIICCQRKERKPTDCCCGAESLRFRCNTQNMENRRSERLAGKDCFPIFFIKKHRKNRDNWVRSLNASDWRSKSESITTIHKETATSTPIFWPWSMTIGHVWQETLFTLQYWLLRLQSSCKKLNMESIGKGEKNHPRQSEKCRLRKWKLWLFENDLFVSLMANSSCLCAKTLKLM